MAFLTLSETKLRHNYQYLESLFCSNRLEWSVVTKLLCGHPEYISLLAAMGVRQCCDSRIANLKHIKKQFPHIETVFIKPPTNRNVAEIARYADISFNTTLKTIKSLSRASVDLGIIHRVVLVVELGELREGILLEELADIFEQAQALPNIEIIGLGANLTCMSGVLPSRENMTELVRYKAKIEKQFRVSLPIVSSGASVTIPLIRNNQLPEGVNHFCIGETLFLGQMCTITPTWTHCIRTYSSFTRRSLNLKISRVSLMEG